MTGRIPMTIAGHIGLQEELKRLKRVERPANVRDIETAREHGDISENAEFHAAKEKQAHLDGRMKMIEDQLARAEVIDTSKLGGTRVVFGARVELLDLNTDEEFAYTLVGPVEADVDEGRISIESPIGRALLGKEEGDDVEVRTPDGLRELEVLGVSFE